MPQKTRGTALRLATPGLAIFLIMASASFLPPAASLASPQTKAKQEERKKPAKPELESKFPQQSADSRYTIGVNVDLVVLHTSVYDTSDRFVVGLKKEDFKVFEDGVAQTIASFSQEDVPVSLGILLDTSGSMRNKIDMITKAALAFIRAGNPEDQTFLVGFSDQVELLEDYTNDIDLITDALENVIVTGGTALYDAIYLGVQKAQKGFKPKKAIIVISDGEDRDSYYKLEELLAKVQESDVQVYCIGFLNPIPEKGLFGRFSKSVPEKAHDALQRISELTGAKAYFPQKVGEINGIVSEIAHELRNQYSIAFVSSNQDRDGAWRRVKVVLEGGNLPVYRVRSRTGYFGPKIP